MLARIVEKQEHSCIVGRNANWCSHSGKPHGDVKNKTKLEIEVPSNPATSLQGISTKNTKSSKGYMHRDVYSSIFYKSQMTETIQAPIN